MTTGKRAGARRSSPTRAFNRDALLVCVGITLAVVAWGYLVYASIDFGTAARASGSASSWGLMALASLGAVACLFVGLMLVARLLRALGLSTSDDSSAPPTGPRPPGGKRAAR